MITKYQKLYEVGMESEHLNEDLVTSKEWPGLIDTHCHLDLEPLSGHLVDVLNDAALVGVTHCVVPGVHPGGWAQMAVLAGKHRQFLPAYGIHPMHAGLADDDCLSKLASFALAGVAIWFVIQPRPYTTWNLFLIIFGITISSFAPSDLFPDSLYRHVIQPYALQALPCTIIWLTIIYEMLFRKSENYLTDLQK